MAIPNCLHRTCEAAIIFIDINPPFVIKLNFSHHNRLFQKLPRVRNNNFWNSRLKAQTGLLRFRMLYVEAYVDTQNSDFMSMKGSYCWPINRVPSWKLRAWVTSLEWRVRGELAGSFQSLTNAAYFSTLVALKQQPSCTPNFFGELFSLVLFPYKTVSWIKENCLVSAKKMKRVCSVLIFFLPCSFWGRSFTVSQQFLACFGRNEVFKRCAWVFWQRGNFSRRRRRIF